MIRCGCSAVPDCDSFFISKQALASLYDPALSLGIRMLSIQERILDLNRVQSDFYIANESARHRYWAKHPTFFACIKCMDGRVNFPIMTNTPVGIVKPFRAIGGKFEAWWPSFLGRVRHWVERAVHMGSRNFMFVTYHYSASDAHLGCAGWKYDTASAKAHAEKLRDSLAYVFGEQLTAVVAGVETDRDILTLHGPAGDISGDGLVGKTPAEIEEALAKCFPELDQQTMADLIPFLVGNAKQVQELTVHPRQHEDKQHRERIIAIGQGFDWIAQGNLALIINDADPNLAESVRVAGSLIEKNLKDAPLGDDAAIFTCIPYHEPGLDHRQAVARARGLALFAENILTEAYPALLASGRVHTLASIMWEPNKKIEVV